MKKINKNGKDSFQIYLDDIKKYPLLAKEEEIELCRKISKGDEKAREELINGNYFLVVNIAKKYCIRYRIDKSSWVDLIQEGNLGLINATYKYDFDKGFKFSTYAFYWIKHKIQRAIENDVVSRRGINTSSQFQESYRKINQFEDNHKKKFGTSPSQQEIATGLSIPLTTVRNNKKTNANLSTRVYFNQEDCLNQEDRLNKQRTFEELISIKDPFSDIIKRDEVEFVSILIENYLSKRDAEILKYRLGFNNERKTLEELSLSFGLTRERIRQIEMSSINKIKEKVKNGLI